jgi:hypothetical protein
VIVVALSTSLEISSSKTERISSADLFDLPLITVPSIAVDAGTWVILARNGDKNDSVAVAEVFPIIETRARTQSVEISARVAKGSIDSAIVVALIQCPDCLGDIAQFLNQCVFNHGNSDSNGTEDERENQHDFCGNNETFFVIDESVHYFEFLLSTAVS